MENIKKRLGNLLAVKSLVTITLTVVFAVLALRESISGSEFLTIFTVVIGFYFGTQRVNEDKNGSSLAPNQRCWSWNTFVTPHRVASSSMNVP